MPDNNLKPVLGIDLGTTFSCAAHWADTRPEVYRLKDGRETIPSIVYIQDGGTPLVGKYARQRLVIDPENGVANIKRFMGDDSKTVTLRGKSYTPVDISALILERIKADIQSMFPSTAGFEIAGVVVTHPQYFKFPQIARTLQAAEQAGLPIIRLLSEPVAAALDYGLKEYQGLERECREKILVFDLGGGTFDVTVLEVINTLNNLTFKVLGVGGDDMLGGTNFDDALQEWCLRQQGIDLNAVDPSTRDRAIMKLNEQCIVAKEELSAMEETFIAVPNILPGQHIDAAVTRKTFEVDVIGRYCDRIRAIVADTIARANLRSGEMNRTILIGGSSRIPIMRKIVQDETGIEPWANADPDLSVCRGAAFLAAMEDGRVNFKKELSIEEVTSHALGVRAADDKFAILIPANRPAPVEATKIFTVNSTEFTVTPYQGSGKKVTEESVIALKPIQILGVQLDSAGRADVKITFKVNEHQLLFVKVDAPGVSEQRQMEF